MTPFTIETVSVSEIKPIKDISPLDPGYKFVLEHTRDDGHILPVILSKNYLVLDGHKSLIAMQAVHKEKFGLEPKEIDVFLLDRVMTETEAWEMHHVYNKKPGNESHYADKIEDNTGKDDLLFMSRSANAVKALYQITSPIKAHLLSVLFASKLSSISLNMHNAFSTAFEKSISMGIRRGE